MIPAETLTAERKLPLDLETEKNEQVANRNQEVIIIKGKRAWI